MQTVHGISKKQGFFVVIQERQQIYTFYYNSFYCDVKERDFLKISLMWLIKICSAEKESAVSIHPHASFCGLWLRKAMLYLDKSMPLLPEALL